MSRPTSRLRTLCHERTVDIARLSRTVFADPSTDPAGYVAEAFSFPLWLINRWQSRFDLSELCRLGFWFDQAPTLSLRVNELKTTRDDLLGILIAQGVPARPGSLAEAIRLEGTLRIDTLPGFADGLFTVQDESAMQAVDLLAPQPGETVLDLCAAPGAKTTHLAERMKNTGSILATDVRAERLKRIEENCQRLGICHRQNGSHLGRWKRPASGPVRCHSCRRALLEHRRLGQAA